MKNILITAFTGIALLSLAACSGNSATSLPPGHYENSTSGTDANGTSTSRDTTTDVTEDANGNKTAVVKKKTTKDPRGLFNKSTATSTQVISDQ